MEDSTKYIALFSIPVLLRASPCRHFEGLQDLTMGLFYVTFSGASALGIHGDAKLWRGRYSEHVSGVDGE